MSRPSLRLAAALAHDINNMLQIVRSYGEKVLSRLPPAHPDREEMLELCAAAQRATELARQLVAVGQRERPRPQRMCIDELLAGIRGMIEQLVGDDVELRVHRSTGLRAVRADPRHIEQVVMNLASNARDAMEGKGTLTIVTGNVDLETGPHVMLAVRDSGVGIDDATRARIFEPFFTTKDRGKGSGLGLAVSPEIVEAAGGTICVDSVPGRGATFRVYLPQDSTSDDALPAR